MSNRTLSEAYVSEETEVGRITKPKKENRTLMQNAYAEYSAQIPDKLRRQTPKEPSDESRIDGDKYATEGIKNLPMQAQEQKRKQSIQEAELKEQPSKRERSKFGVVETTGSPDYEETLHIPRGSPDRTPDTETDLKPPKYEIDMKSVAIVGLAVTLITVVIVGVLKK